MRNPARSVVVSASSRVRDGAVEISSPGFALGDRDLQEPVEEQDVLLAEAFDAAAHALESLGSRAGVGGRPAFEKYAEWAEHRQIVLADDPTELGDAHPGARTVAAHHGQHGGQHRAERKRVGIGEAPEPRSHPLSERDRPIHLAERPQRERQKGHRGELLGPARTETPFRRRARVGTGQARVPSDHALRQILPQTSE